MRVRQGESGTTSARSRPSPQHAVYEIIEDRESSMKTERAGFEAACNSMVLENGRAFNLDRPSTTAIFEDDKRTKTSSLIKMVSQLRKEFHLGLPWNNQTALGGSAFPTSQSKEQSSREGSEAFQLFEVSHQVSFSPAAPKGGQLDSFVYKNYPLKDQRCLSPPVGKEYTPNEYVAGHSCQLMDGQKVTQQQSMPPARTFSFIDSTMRLTESLAIPNDEGVDCYGTDFDVEVDRRSKLALLLHVGYCLLRAVAAIVSVYVYIRFSTSRSIVLEYESEVSPTSSLNLDEDGPVSFFFGCNIFVNACPCLGILFALFTIMSGDWEIYGGHLWTQSYEADSCRHCQELEDRRVRIERADERVQRAQRAKQQFMAYVFHNIRVPFNAIVLGLGHIQASGDGAGPIGDVTDKVDLVQMMLDCAETMTSVLDDVTDMGQWEVGQIELHNDEFDILALIKFLSWGLKDLLQQKEITFNMAVDEIVNKLLASHFVLGDKQKIVQTLGNFLSNAVKFTPAGGKLDLKVHCEGVVDSKHAGLSVLADMSSSSTEPITRTGDPLLGATCTSFLTKTSSQTKHIGNKVARLRISVSDDGIGISAEDQTKLFEPYSFVTSGWVQKGGVSGLGLSMAKRYVEKVGGNIGVESSVGKGSMFFFSIPFPLVPRNDNNKDEVLDSNSEAFQNSEASDFTRTYNLSVAQKSVSRRKSMEQKVKSVQMQLATKSFDNEEMDEGLVKGRHFSWKTLV